MNKYFYILVQVKTFKMIQLNSYKHNPEHFVVRDSGCSSKWPSYSLIHLLLFEEIKIT